MKPLLKAASVLRFAVAASGPQNFLGGSWVKRSLQRASDKQRRARRLLFLSPHYFCLEQNHVWPPDSELEAEVRRNKESREIIANEVIAPFTKPGDLVIDYGCGPGFMAAAMSKHVAKVIACDISDGVLGCARVLNAAPNIEYRNASHLPPYVQRRADLVYCFAVAQHLADNVLSQVLRSIAGILRNGGKVLMHVVIDAPGWKTEADWFSDNSFSGKMKRRFGLHCFTRSEQQIRELLATAGFSVSELAPMTRYMRDVDDIARQHLVVATKNQ